MDAIGTEVGQKMRSAIRAKLMELGCYVDDELPDYVMVMVANKRTRSQMDEDLQLFLRDDTKVFVDWLQQVLKKLKEVTITNPEVFSELKRKASIEIAECAIKKEKGKKIKLEKKPNETIEQVKSITDEIPVSATILVEKRLQNNRLLENKINNCTEPATSTVVNEDNFDIPSLAEVNDLEDSDLDLIEDKIKKARNRIVLMKSDSEDEDFLNIGADAELSEELLGSEIREVGTSITSSVEKQQSSASTSRIIKIRRQNSDKQPVSKTVTITEQHEQGSKTSPPKSSHVKTTKSVLERLGIRQNDCDKEIPAANTEIAISKSKRVKITLADSLREEKEMSGRIRSRIHSIITKPTPNKVEKHKRESVHKRLGMPSSVVTLPKKIKEKELIVSETQQKLKVLPSVVQVSKPRRPLPGLCQANKNLLLKAVAEAQKSVTQMPARGASKIVTEEKKIEKIEKKHTSPPKAINNKEALFTKKYREKHNLELKKSSCKKHSEPENVIKVQNIIIEVKSNNSKSNAEVLDENSTEYIPSPVAKESENIEESDYVPSTIDLSYDEDLKYLEELDSTNDTRLSDDSSKEMETETNHQFIVTLDGIKSKDIIKNKEETPLTTVKSNDQVNSKRVPSPIIFDKVEKTDTIKSTPKIPDKLPKVHAPISIKTKERCKYWPGCRSGDTCEYVHPSAPCKMFPLCKFGERCLYIHPKCKFDASCTRKDCPYSHGSVKVPVKIVPRAAVTYPVSQDVCKYYPNCSNPHCHFYHPRPCRFGKYCVNKSECNFSHGTIPTKEKLVWHSSVG